MTIGLACKYYLTTLSTVSFHRLFTVFFCDRFSAIVDDKRCRLSKAGSINDTGLDKKASPNNVFTKYHLVSTAKQPV